MSAVILSHCHTLQMMDILLGNETLQSLITLCGSANRVIFISLSFCLSLLAQSHPGLSYPLQPRGTRLVSLSPAPTVSQSSAGEKPGLRNHAKANRAKRGRWRRRRLSLPKTNREWEKQRKRTSGGSKANNQWEREATSTLAVVAASPLTAHRVIPHAIFFFSYLGKLASAFLSPAHIMLFNIITSNKAP